MDPTSQLRAAITASSLPLPSASFLTTLTSSSATTSRDSLLATARARILACDLTRNGILDASLAPLPPAVDNPAVEESRLPRPVHVQVLDVENLGLSRWEQVEELEAVARGEGTRGREVVRVVAAAEDGAGGAESQAPQQQQQQQQQRPAGGKATHRLVLQDCKGKKVFGVELKRVERVGLGRTCIGEKMLLRAGTTVARGVVLLTPETCVMLGGKVDAWHKSWTDGRLTRLKEAAGSDRPL